MLSPVIEIAWKLPPPPPPHPLPSNIINTKTIKDVSLKHVDNVHIYDIMVK